MELVCVNEMLPEVEAIECSLADAAVSESFVFTQPRSLGVLRPS